MEMQWRIFYFFSSESPQSKWEKSYSREAQAVNWIQGDGYDAHSEHSEWMWVEINF